MAHRSCSSSSKSGKDPRSAISACSVVMDVSFTNRHRTRILFLNSCWRSVEDYFVAVKISQSDYEINRYRKAVPVDRRWFYLAVFVLLGMLWPIMLAVLCVVIGARKAIVLLRK